MKVIDERPKVAEDATFKEILMSGDTKAVLRYMETTDQIDGINSQSSFNWNGYHVLSWFLEDHEFYKAAIAIL